MPPKVSELTDEERQQRSDRLKAEHEAYIKSISTSRSLPRLRSTIAGAGGKTNEQARIAEEHEADRMKRLLDAAESAARRQALQDEHNDKVEKLEAVQSKKRQRRAAKKKKKQARKLEAPSSGSSSSSDDESADSADS